MSGNHLNDLSKVYLDKIAKINATTAAADKNRWEDLGGPTPENYQPTGDSAKIKEDYASTKTGEVVSALKRDPKVRKRFEKAAKKEGGPGSAKNRAADDMLQTAKDTAKRKGDTSKSDDSYAYESFSNWRDDLREIVSEPEDKAEKKVSEKKGISNKIVINPKLDEAIKEIGGELLEIAEIDKDKEQDAAAAKQIASKQKRASMIKKQVLMKKLQAVRAGSEDIVASYEPEIDAAVEYFYEEGLNEDGIDLLIEEIGLEEFVDFVTDIEFLTEDWTGPSGKVYKQTGTTRDARKMNIRSLKSAQKKAAETKADKSDVVKRGTPADTVARARAERASKKPKLAKPAKKDHDGDGKVETPKAEHRGSRNKAIAKAVSKAKATQPAKKPSKEGIGSKVRTAVRNRIAADKKGVRKVRDTVRKVQKSSFGKGVVSGVKAVGKAAKDVKGVLDANKSKTVNMQSYEPEGEMIAEKDLNAAERRALPDKEFALPGKGKGPEGKQAGSYPIPDKNHARMALAMVAKHGTPEKKAQVRAAVEKKFPGIEVSEAVKGEDTQSRKDASAERRSGEVGGVKTPKRISPSKGRDYVKGTKDSIDWWKNKTGVKEAKVDTVKKLDDEGKEDARNLRKYGTKHSQFFQSVRRRQEHRANRGVKEDAAFDKVAGDLKKKYGSGVLVGKEKPPAPTEAEKKEYKAHQAKIASQDTRDDLEKSSRGRYSRRHSNAGSD